MTISKSKVSYASRLMLWGAPGSSPSSTVTWKQVEGILAKRTRPLEASGVEAIRVAYDEAKRAARRNPTLKEVNALVTTARNAVANERGPGRVNDGFVDEREAASLKTPLARSVYTYLDTVFPAEPVTTSSVEASFAQLDKAYSRLSAAVDDGFERFGRIANGGYAELMKSMRESANAAGLPESARATLLLATNGKVGRGDNGSLDDGGSSLPSKADVKKALENAREKLKGADGALIVDFAHASTAPRSKKDKVVTDLEMSRTPAVTGQAARKYLEYASRL